MSLNECKTCGSSIVIAWTYIQELDGWLGKGACGSCGHTSIHLAGNPQFQHNAKRFIAALTSPFGF